MTWDPNQAYLDSKKEKKDEEDSQIFTPTRREEPSSTVGNTDSGTFDPNAFVLEKTKPQKQNDIIESGYTAIKAPSFDIVSNPFKLANFVKENEITNLKQQKWWNDAPFKKEAWELIQREDSEKQQEAFSESKNNSKIYEGFDDIKDVLKQKAVPKNIFDTNALGIGKVQGWCGEYASRISTAVKVGNTWGEKKQRIDKRDGVKAGDKILIPLGVKTDTDYGHVMAAVTDQDDNGNFVVAQSNADGRQNRGQGLGVATLAVYNTYELQKKYGDNWGAASGKLKVNAYKDKDRGAVIAKAQQQNEAKNFTPPKAVTEDAYALASFVKANKIQNLKGNEWWDNSPAKKEAWALLNPAPIDNYQSTVDFEEKNTVQTGVFDGFGSISSRFESGGKYDRVSSGAGDPGGVSYGKYQLASKAGSVQSFLTESGYQGKFQGLAVNSQAFKNKWQELSSSPEFQQAQDDYAYNHYYKPLAGKLKDSGINLEGRGPGVKETILSMAIQHVGAYKVIKDVLSNKNISQMSDSDLINTMFDARVAYVMTLSSLPGNTKMSIVKNRYPAEREAILKMNEEAEQYQNVVNPITQGLSAMFGGSNAILQTNQQNISKKNNEKSFDSFDGGLKSFLDRVKDEKTNKQPEPEGWRTSDLEPQYVANFIAVNGITDLKNKAWFTKYPKVVREEIWGMVNKKLGKDEYDTGDGRTLSEKAGESIVDAIFQTFAPDKGPNPYMTGERTFLDGLSEQKTAELQYAWNKAGKGIQARVETVQAENEGNWLTDNFVSKAVFGSVAGIGSGITKLSGGQNRDNIQVVSGLKDIGFGAAGIAIPQVAGFNMVVSMPGIEEPAAAVFEKFEELKMVAINNTPYLKDAHPEVKDLVNLGIDLWGFDLVIKGVKKGKEVATTKKVQYTPEQVTKVLKDISEGKMTQNKNALRTKVETLIRDAEQGWSHQKALAKSYTEGITIREARDYANWFNRFFKPLKNKDVPVKAELSPEFEKLLDQGTLVQQGQLTPVAFFKDARKVFAKGESATLRDAIPGKVNEAALYERNPRGELIFDNVAQAKGRLHDLQELGKKEVIKVTHGDQKALSIETYTYSDGLVGVGFTLKTETGNIKAPISGKFETPREAVREVIPMIEKAVEKGSDTASEVVRTKIDELKRTNFKEIPKKSEVSPWEDNAPPQKIKQIPEEMKKMSKENIKQETKKMVDEYIDVVLQGGKKGVKIEKGKPVKSLNPEWYRKAFKEQKEMGKNSVTKAKLREVAIDHLMNGVKDDSIGIMPANSRYIQLQEALKTAKSEIVMKAGEAPAPKPISKSTISTPESRAEARMKPVENPLGKIKESKNFKKVQERLETELKANKVEYNVMNIIDDAGKAIAFTEKNYDFARKVALGLEAPPEGISRTAINHAVAEQAKSVGDLNLQARIETAHSLHLTRAGQEIVAERGRLDSFSPESFIKQVMQSKMEAAKQHSYNLSTDGPLGKRKKMDELIVQEASNLRQEIKNNTKRTKKEKAIEDAQNILDQLTCKL